MPKKTYPTPSDEEMRALYDYREWWLLHQHNHPKDFLKSWTWKKQLLDDWMRAGSIWPGEWAPLQRLRNSHGPSWVTRDGPQGMTYMLSQFILHESENEPTPPPEPTSLRVCDLFSVGDVVRSRALPMFSYVVVGFHGKDVAVLSRTITLTNPSEWEKV